MLVVISLIFLLVGALFVFDTNRIVRQLKTKTGFWGSLNLRVNPEKWWLRVVGSGLAFIGTFFLFAIVAHFGSH